jgi:hypothetical protein
MSESHVTKAQRQAKLKKNLKNKNLVPQYPVTLDMALHNVGSVVGEAKRGGSGRRVDTENQS